MIYTLFITEVVVCSDVELDCVLLINYYFINTNSKEVLTITFQAQYVSELMYWIALGVPNKVAAERV